MRLLLITDFTELFPYRLLKGILQYAQDSGEHWVICKMPPSYKREFGLRRVVSMAEAWRADVVIGQFDPEENLSLFLRKGIVVMAQDYINTFDNVPNITANYGEMGRMAAERFISQGFRNFAFFGNNGMCWSDGRRDGFRERLEEAGYGDRVFIYDKERVSNLWYYNQAWLHDWLQSLPKPVGIMACDDNQASILVEACNSIGIRVPFEAAIIGVDNDEILCSMSDPPLSSINVDIERGGYETARLAVQMVKDPHFKWSDIVLEPLAIISRSSSNVIATEDKAIHDALQFINDNIDHKILVTDVLEHVPMSRRLLEQRFLKATGTTIYQYITLLRINRFAEKLLSSKDPIAEIAASMDEPDPKSLSRRFLSIKGCTPSEYRKRNGRKIGE